MTINHHPDDATLTGYAAGSLAEALRIAVAAHLAVCPRCRGRVRTAETIGGAFLETDTEAEISSDALARAMARIETAAAQLAGQSGGRSGGPAPAASVGDPRVPPPLGRLLDGGLDEIRWRWIAPGIYSHEILMSPKSGNLLLLKIASGKAMPDHGHGGTELTMVLSGSYSDETGKYGPGDVADLADDVVHSPKVDSEESCVCLVATEAPTRFEGRIARLLQPYLRI